MPLPRQLAQGAVGPAEVGAEGAWCERGGMVAVEMLLWDSRAAVLAVGYCEWEKTWCRWGLMIADPELESL